eukprot:9431956-Lingulodinium_polyedra.AAC.1
MQKCARQTRLSDCAPPPSFHPRLPRSTLRGGASEAAKANVPFCRRGARRRRPSQVLQPRNLRSGVR